MPSQENMYLMGSEKLPSASYILSDESGIPFYSTSNGYNQSCFKHISIVLALPLVKAIDCTDFTYFI